MAADEGGVDVKVAAVGCEAVAPADIDVFVVAVAVVEGETLLCC